MYEQEIKKYQTLNELAEAGGIVIFGEQEDLNIPLCELKQAFELEAGLYNRSFPTLSVTEAAVLYDNCAAPIMPETVLLHIGQSDCGLFESNPMEFEKQYRQLIRHIKSHDKACRIVVVSLKNYEKNEELSRLNKQLAYIAESEQCEFCDIAEKGVWNPQQKKAVASFVYNIGFVHPLRGKRPVFDLVKSLFCFEA